MKALRYMLGLLISLVAIEASAWTAEQNKAILMLAEENLSGKAKRKVVEILGTELPAIKFENKGKSKTRLNEEGKSVTTDEKDAIVRLEKAIATLSNRAASAEERKAALRTAVETSVDIHCVANILIDKHREADFMYGRDNGRPKHSRWFKVEDRGWENMWHKHFHKALGAFSAEMYIYDWHIATKGMAKNYKRQEVAPRAWAEKTGEIALKALKIFQPKAIVNRIEIVRLEETSNQCMYDAAFHLALLLNKTLK